MLKAEDILYLESIGFVKEDDTLYAKADIEYYKIERYGSCSIFHLKDGEGETEWACEIRLDGKPIHMHGRTPEDALKKSKEKSLSYINSMESFVNRLGKPDNAN